MIVSRSHRFLFIKGRKVGGTSAECVLSALCGSEDIITPITPRDERERLQHGRPAQNYGCRPSVMRRYLQSLEDLGLERLGQRYPPRGTFYNHMPLTEVLDHLEFETSDFRVVCCERSPYAKVLSWANSRVGFARYRRGQSLVVDDSALFDELREIFRTGEFSRVLNVDLYEPALSEGRLEVVHMEALEEELTRFVRSLGVGGSLSVPHLKRSHQFRHEDAAAYLEAPMIEQIDKVFEQEFQSFGYQRLSTPGRLVAT